MIINIKKTILFTFLTVATYMHAQIKIGNNPTTLTPSAILDLESTNKGFLMPRVALASITDQTTIASPAVGLIAYNLGTGALKYVGYVYWNGTEWRTIENTTAVSPHIDTILCREVTFNPSTYKVGVPYNGTLRLPYKGGNEGYYSTGTAVIVNGMTFQLKSGKLALGDGELVFTVTGTPAVSSPTTTLVAMNSTTIPFYSGTACDAIVGAGAPALSKSVAVLGPLTYTNDNGVPGYAVSLTTPDGKFSIRAFLAQNYNYSETDLQLRSNDINRTIMWNGVYLAPGAGGARGNGTTFPADMWAGAPDAAGLATPIASVAGFPAPSLGTAWGDPDVYYISPEQRLYKWATTNTADKTFYQFTFMLGAPTPTENGNTTNCANGTCHNTKCYFLLEQINAQ